MSRITVRKAMQALEEAGVVTRARGYGTQINNIFEYSLKEARGFSQQVVLRGKMPNTLWVNKRVVKCPEEIARHLSLAPDSDVFLLKRIRYVDDDAVSIEVTGTGRINPQSGRHRRLALRLLPQPEYLSAAHPFPRQRPDAGQRVSGAYQDGR